MGTTTKELGVLIVEDNISNFSLIAQSFEDGNRVLEKLRSSNLKDIPVVAVTAHASDEQMKKARRAGYDGFLGKPLDADRFPQQVLRVIAGEQVWEID